MALGSSSLLALKLCRWRGSRVGAERISFSV
jgi:hypothetical protein